VNAQVGGLVVGVWRIRPFLEGEVQRRGLGPMKGNCSRLFPATGSLLAVTEGVEDALAYHELSGVPAWASLNAGNLAELVLPVRFTEVHVVADADDVGMQRAREAVLRFRREGRDARLIRPVGAKDANDVLRARRAVG
jgi:putative DNA primase/helicase